MSKKDKSKSEPSLQFIELISPVTKRLVVGKEGAFCRRINDELRLVTITQNTGQHLKLGIRGSRVAEQATIDLIANMEKQAQIIINRDKLETVKAVKEHHWYELEHHFNKLIEAAKERISFEQRNARTAQVAAEEAVRKATEKFSPLLKSYKEATKNRRGETAGVLQKGHIALLAEYQPRNVNSALAYTALRDREIVAAFMAGDPGGGKTITALAAAIDVYNKGEIDKIQIFRPRTSTGKKDMGAFPGGPDGKMGPYVKGGINSNLIKLTGLGLEHFVSKGIMAAATPDLERGETHDRTFMIIDEAQNLTVSEAELLERRLGEGTRMVFTGDFAGQNDLYQQEPGLVRMIVAIGHNVQHDPLLAETYAFIRFTEEDSKARNPLITSIIKAHQNLPEEYEALRVAFNETERNPKRIKTLEDMKSLASKILEEPALRTAQRFEAKAKANFPSLFQPEPSNVVKLPARQVS